nr:Glu-tRNA(Gln) amidotransferase subunit GatE [Candidatus Woesearchaeota archaeon]
MNFNDLGLKIGIELHVQVNSGKLFCRCPSNLSGKDAEFKLIRKLRTVSSELGEKDIVAEYELEKNKYAIYEMPEESSCLIEADEEPIMEIDNNALMTALQVSLMLNAKVVDVLQIMRKQVLDFSNTSSFQRTGILAMNGKVKTRTGIVNIDNIAIEEDAARKINETKEYVVYRLDRLGFPLIEISTGPNMNDPEQAKEVAQYIGMVLKSTGKIKPGIGTIRQDLNISIKGHPRIEIKGVQDLRAIPEIIRKEAERQLNEVKTGKKLESHVRKANIDNTTSYLRPMPGAARLYVETDHPVIMVTEDMIKTIKMPELISERVLNLESRYNINPQLANEIIRKNIDVDYFIHKFKNIDVDYLSHVLVEMEKEIEARFKLKAKFKKEEFEEVLSYYDKKEIAKEAVFDIFLEKAQGKRIDYGKYRIFSAAEIEDEVKKLVKEKKELSDNAIMGILMQKYRGKIDARKLMDIIRRYK